MAVTATERMGSREYRYTSDDRVCIRVFDITETNNPYEGSTAVGLPARGDAHPDDGSLYADEAHFYWVEGGNELVRCDMTYRERSRDTRRVVGQTEDTYFVELEEEWIKFSEDVPAIPMGTETEGVRRKTGRLIWRRIQWRAASNHAVAEPLIYTKNDALFEGYAAGLLLLRDYRCTELGKNVWQAEYEFTVDSRDAHTYLQVWRAPFDSTVLGTDVCALYATVDWTGLFA